MVVVRIVIIMCIKILVVSSDPQVPSFGKTIREAYFQFQPGFLNFNHGGFGATPKPVRRMQNRFIDEQEAQPTAWFASGGYQKVISEVRPRLAEMMGANATDVATRLFFCLPYGEKNTAIDACVSRENSGRTPNSGRRRKYHRIWLHIYDLDTVMARLNQTLLRQMGLGAFHVGVEVLGDEWYFRWADTPDSGVVWMRPQAHQVHIYTESVDLGFSKLNESQIRSVLGEMVDQWPANSYHPVKRNCLHFAQAFVVALQCPEPFPEWVLGLPDAIQTPRGPQMP
eukprot:g3682.t2